MSHDDDLRRLAQQEERLTLMQFDSRAAWAIVTHLRERALAQSVAIAIDITLHSMPLAYLALPGTTPDNANWVRRKRNTTLRLFRSSYAVGLALAQHQTSLAEKYALDPADYCAHGGSIPIRLAGTGVVGALTVSGLPQREDHVWATEALAEVMGLSLQDCALDV